MLSIRSFFLKENELTNSQLKKPLNFRLKTKHSLKVDLTNPIIDDLSHRTSIGGFGFKAGHKFNINITSITKIE